MARAFWLTAKVETGAKFGSIVMYDGTAVTAGLDQHIAVYPKELAKEDYNAKDDQGGLWKLLRRMEVVGGTHYQILLSRLFGLLKFNGWYLSQDGYLRYLEDGEFRFSRNHRVTVNAGDLVYGADIRNNLTPVAGKVPKKGPEWDHAVEWCEAFHHVFSHADTFQTQIEYGQEHLVKRTKRRKYRCRFTDGSRGWKSVHDYAYLSREISAIRVGKDGWDERKDLAMCVYQSHSVNAPAIANKCLAKAMNKPKRFSEYLIRYLGNSSFGRWDDDIKTGRYQRTRSAAMASKLWPRSLFVGSAAIMPKDLPG